MAKNAVAVIVVVCLLAPGLWGARLSTEIADKSKDLEKVRAELELKRLEKERLKKEAESLTNEVKQTEYKVTGLQKSLLNAQVRTREIEQQLAQTKNERDRYIEKLDRNTDVLKNSLQTYYLASSVMPSSSFVPVYARHLNHAQMQHIKRLEGRKQEADGSLNELGEIHDVVRSEMERQESQLIRAQNGLEDKEKLLEKKLTRRQIIERELKDLERTAEEMVSLIDVLRSKVKEEAEKEKKERLAKQASGQSPIPARSLPWPLSGKILEAYGRHKHPELGTSYISNGIVIGSDKPADIHAVSSGRILYAGIFMSYGSMVLVEHPGDWYTVYGRLSQWNVEKGQAVNKGDVLGRTSTNTKGQAETYFELRFYGKPTNPLPWLQQ